VTHLPVTHQYVRFRIRLARHGLRQFVASFLSSTEIFVLLCGPFVLGLVGAVALPPMLAASEPLSLALPLLTVHGLLMALPAALLRKRVLPQDVVLWLHPLPVPPRQQALAALAVAGMLAGPLGLAYLASFAACLWQRPAWLLPLPASAAVLFSLAVTWAASAAILARRARLVLPNPRWRHIPGAAPAPFARGARRPVALMLWLRLFWLPFWRAENVVGWQQSALLAACAASALAWVTVRHGALALSTSVLLVLLTDRGDKAVREQAARLQPVMAGWPAPLRRLSLLARAFSLLPALAVMAALLAAAPGMASSTAGRAYLGLGLSAQLLLVGIPSFSARGRVALAFGAMLLMTAVGSEIWH
jgi:hypothetical protein